MMKAQTIILTKQNYQRYILYICTEYAVLIGLFLRLFVAWFLPWILDHNSHFLPGVDYTDIDLYVPMFFIIVMFHVFTFCTFCDVSSSNITFLLYCFYTEK
jgi:hypothetical protein